MKDINSFSGKYRFLSNFWLGQIVYEDITYPSVEHAYQAAKTLDHEVRFDMSFLDTPAKAKKAGKSLEIRPDWDLVKFGIMYQLVLQKFSDNRLRNQLIETGDAELIEGNYWHDTIWGKCTCPKHKGEGDNHLGKILMKVRDICKKS